MSEDTTTKTEEVETTETKPTQNRPVSYYFPNRAERRRSRYVQRHCSKPGTRGRAPWNWQKGAFGQPKWRRVEKETA